MIKQILQLDLGTTIFVIFENLEKKFKVSTLMCDCDISQC